MTAWRLRTAFLLLALPAVILLSSIVGCVQTFDATTLGVPVTLASPAGQQPEGARFKVTSHALYAFWGLAKIKDPSLRKALAAQLAGGGGIADLKIKVHSGLGDVLVTALTAGLIVPRAVTFEGIVTK